MISIQRNPMRNRIVLVSALVVFTVALLLYEAHAGQQRAPDHCGFWTTIDAGLSCR
ncbi:hypothetical protein WI560_28075 [Bradyrhizobium sp. A11]|uniref:hypothetical protein n=1 Tax=Bradyrhizobium sp. A11 TaxID=3133974 RepID=UPI0032540003